MKKILAAMLILNSGFTPMHAMEEKPREESCENRVSKKRKRPIKKETKSANKQLKKEIEQTDLSMVDPLGAKTDWESLPNEIKQEIFYHVAHDDPTKAFKDLRNLALINAESSLITNYYPFIKLLATHWVTHYPNESQHVFSRACGKASKNIFDAFVDAGIPVNSKDKSGISAHTHAIENQRIDNLQTLYQKGAGASGLGFLVMQGNKDIAKFLLQAGALRTRQSALSQQFLAAVILNEIDRVKELIQQGADVDATGSDDRPALMIAAANDYQEMVALLIQKGAYLDHEAAYDLNQYGDVDLYYESSPEDTTALYWAARNGCTEVVKQLLDAGAALDVRAFFQAVEHDHKAIVELLLSKEVDVNSKKLSGGETALMVAAYKGQKKMVKILIMHGAAVNEKNNNGFAPLIAAVVRGHKKVVEILIKHGADVNNRGNGGSTPLMMAAVNGDEAIVKILLAGGAEVNATDDKGIPALMYAIAREHFSIAELLSNNGAGLECARKFYGIQ